MGLVELVLPKRVPYGMKAASKKPKLSKPSALAAPAKPLAECHELPARSFDLRPLKPLTAVAFFLTYFLCLWKWVDVRLIYHGGGQVQDFPSFYWGWEFARPFQTHPGGFVEYCSALLAQSLYSSWFGALLLTLQAAAVYGSVNGCLRVFGTKRVGWLSFIPPLLYLSVYSSYRHYSAPLTSFALGVIALWLWLRLSSKKSSWRLGNAVVLSACLYAVAPSALLAIFPAALLYEGLSSKSPLQLLLLFGLISVIPCLEGAAPYGFAAGEAYAKLLPLAWDPIIFKMTGIWLVIVLYALPLVFCLAGVLRVLGGAWKRRKADSKALGTLDKTLEQARELSPKRSEGSFVIASWMGRTLGVAVLPLAVVLITLNPRIRAFLMVDYLAWHGRWAEVPLAAKANPRNDVIACTLAQARFHTGNLTTELPTLPSPADLLLFNDKQQAHWKRSDLYYDLGYLNMALHHLTEAMEFYGERPVLLQRLALVNLALTNISTAKVYLGTLTRAPFQGSWARNYLDRLEKDPVLTSDEEVARLRRLMVRRDSVIILTPDEELLMLLAANRQNRMAFEYLMTYYLLTKNLQAFVKNIARVKDFPGLEISPMWDEALLLASLEAGRSLEIPGHVICSEARSRVNAVNQVIKKNGENAQLSRHELTADYAHTYSYYWWFHL
jgi:hypothetical protein